MLLSGLGTRAGNHSPHALSVCLGSLSLLLYYHLICFRAVLPSLLHGQLWLYGCRRRLLVVKSDSPVTLPRLLMLLAVNYDEFTMYLLNSRVSIQNSNALMLH